MANQPVFAADTPLPKPSELAMLDAGYSPQTVAAAQHPQDLVHALAAMRDPAKEIRTPDVSLDDRLAEALMQRRYGEAMQDFARPASSRLDQPGGGQSEASAPAVAYGLTYGAPQMQAGMIGKSQIDTDGELYLADEAQSGVRYTMPGPPGLYAPTFDGPIPSQQAGIPQGGEVNFDDLIPNQGTAQADVPAFSDKSLIHLGAAGVNDWDSGDAGVTPGGQSAQADAFGDGASGSTGNDVIIVSTPHVIANDGTDLGESDGANEPGEFVPLNYTGGMPSRNLWPAGMTASYGAIKYLKTGNKYFVFAGPDGTPRPYAVEYWTGAGQGAGGGIRGSAGGPAPAASGAAGGQPAPAPAPDGGILDDLHGALAAASFVPELGSIAQGVDAGLSGGQAVYDFASGNAGRAWGELAAAGISAAAAGIGLFDGDAGATRTVEQAAADGIKSAESAPQSVDLALTYKPGWTSQQIAEADAKVRILDQSDTIVTAVDRSGTSARGMFTQSGGLASPTQDVDHMVDLQLGGSGALQNLWSLDSSVNRSLGAQIYRQIKDFPPGTIVNRVRIGPR